MKEHLTARQNERVRNAARRVIGQFGGNLSAAAKMIRVERSWLHRFMDHQCGASLDYATLIANAVEEPVQELLELSRGPVTAWAELPGFDEALAKAKLMAPQLAEQLDDVGGFMSAPNPEEVDAEMLLQIALILQKVNRGGTRAKKLTSGSDTSPPSKPRGARRSASKIKTQP